MTLFGPRLHRGRVCLFLRACTVATEWLDVRCQTATTAAALIDPDAPVAVVTISPSRPSGPIDTLAVRVACLA